MIYSTGAVPPLCLHILPLLHKLVINHLGSSIKITYLLKKQGWIRNTVMILWLHSVRDSPGNLRQIFATVTQFSPFNFFSSVRESHKAI